MDAAATSQKQLSFGDPEAIELDAMSPFEEMGAYESLWMGKRVTFKNLAEKIANVASKLPSALANVEEARQYADFVMQKFENAGIEKFGVCIDGMAEYPPKLRDAKHPVSVLYYSGLWSLVWSRSVAVVGTRHPTREGLSRTKKLVEALVGDDITVVSGLAAGVDTMAHRTAIKAGGRTIAVLGTPLSENYPKENEELQREIARDFLVISQVPVKRYDMQSYRGNRLFFPERNITMSALTEATVIVEAGETSGTLVQARAALEQGRHLFILASCFENGLEWPHKLENKGAVRVGSYADISSRLLETPN